MGAAGITFLLAAQLKARDLGASPARLGIQSAANLAMYVVGNAFMGWLIRRVRRRALLMSAPMVCLIAALVVFRTEDYRMMPLLMALSGLGSTAFWAPMEVTIAEETHPRHLARNLGLFNVSWTSAFMLAPPACGALYDGDPRFPFLLVFGIYVVLIGLLAVTRFAPRATEPDDDDHHPAAVARVAPGVARTHLVLVGIAIIAQGFMSFTFVGLFPDVTKGNGFPDFVPGLMIGLRGLALLASFFVLSRTSRWHYRFNWLVAAQIASAAAVLAIAHFSKNLVLLAVAFPVTGVAYAFCYNASILYAVSNVGSREVHSARHELLVGSGPAFGPLIVGFAASMSGSYPLAFSICALVIVIALVIQFHVLGLGERNSGRQD